MSMPDGRVVLLAARRSCLRRRLRSSAAAADSAPVPRSGPPGDVLIPLHVPWLSGLPRLESAWPPAGAALDGPPVPESVGRLPPFANAGCGGDSGPSRSEPPPARLSAARSAARSILLWLESLRYRLP